MINCLALLRFACLCIDTTVTVRICKIAVIVSGSIYRVTDEGWVAETAVWPISFMFSLLLKGLSFTFYSMIMFSHHLSILTHSLV